MIQTEYCERRRYPRYQPSEGALATAKHVLGPIVDISLGGMAFEYFQDGANGSQASLIGIMHPEQDFWLEQIPCRTVAEQLVNSACFTPAALRKRRRVAFRELTLDQQQKLEQFIQGGLLSPA